MILSIALVIGSLIAWLCLPSRDGYPRGLYPKVTLRKLLACRASHA